MTQVKLAFILGLFSLCLADGAAAQDTIPTADASIVSVSSSDAGAYQCRITLRTDGPAANLMLIVLLPAGLEVTGVPGGATGGTGGTCMESSPSPTEPDAYVMCTVNIPAGRNQSRNVIGTLPDPPPANIDCSAFVLSTTPDTDTSNNFGTP